MRKKLQAALTAQTFKMLKAGTTLYNRFSLPVISTGRSFAYYREVFFAGAQAQEVLSALKGKTIVDVGCGLTPYVSDSMFQACREAGIDFYGVDPKLSEGFRFGAFDRLKVRGFGSRGKLSRNAKGLDKAIAARADDLPFSNGSVDLILSNYLLYAWIDSEPELKNIFTEFYRVLAIGGTINVYPTPVIEITSINDSDLRRILEKFDIEQSFQRDWLRPGYIPPAYMTRCIKKSSNPV